VFEETNKAEIDVRVFPKQTGNGILEIDVTDQFGNRPVRIRFDADGKIKAVNGNKEVILQSYKQDTWYDLKVTIDANTFGNYTLSLDGKQLLKNAKLAEAVKSVERVSFRTGPYRDLPNRNTPNQDPAPPLPGADEQITPASFYIDDFRVNSGN
jgi:hypothetical protein